MPLLILMPKALCLHSAVLEAEDRLRYHAGQLDRYRLATWLAHLALTLWKEAYFTGSCEQRRWLYPASRKHRWENVH